VRFINLDGQEPKKAWLDKARTLSDQLDAAETKEARHKIIEDNSAVWGDLKPWLLKLSKGKCWFSEALPYLLDPTRPDDPLFLCFDENGDVKALPDLDAWNTARVEESNKRYKLREHEPLMEARRDIWSRCDREVNLCQNLMDELLKNPTATKKEAVRQQIRKLKDMVSFEAEFSATACECLRNRREQWAQRLASQAA
jgi:hypothetical protein